MNSIKDIPLNRKLLFVLVFFCLICYFPAFNASYLYFDEYISVLQNPQIQAPLTFEALKQIFTTFTENQYTPLSIFSFWIEFNLFGYNSQIAHIINFLIHLAGVFALYYFILELLENTAAAFFIATIWAIHPLQVESVAWVLGRRTILYGSLFIASLAFYTKYLNTKSNTYKTLAIITMILSGLSKTLAFTAPIAWLGIDWIKGRTFSFRLITEKIAGLLFAIILASVMLIAANDGITNSEDKPLNIKDALFSMGYYPVLTICPHKLSGTNEINPATQHILDSGPVLFSIFLVLSLMIGVKSKIAVFGLLFYLLHILPMSGLVRVGYPFYVSYHFCYVAQTGLFLIIAGLLRDIVYKRFCNKTLRKSLATVCIIYLIILGWQTIDFCIVWQNTENLFSNSLKLDPVNRFARNMLTKYYIAIGDYAKAEIHCNELLRQHPDFFGGYYHKSAIMMKNHKFTEACKLLDKAIELAGYRVDVTYSRGFCRFLLKDWKGTEEDFSILLEKDPEYIEPLHYRAIARSELGKYNEADMDYKKLCRLVPDNLQYKQNWLKNSLKSLNLRQSLLIIFDIVGQLSN